VELASAGRIARSKVTNRPRESRSRPCRSTSAFDTRRHHTRTLGSSDADVLNVIILTDTRQAGSAVREGLAAMLGTSPEAVAGSPMALIGTPDEVIAELRRRVTEWDLRELVIQLQDEALVTRFAREVMPALRE
jgi:dihydroxyacid dehydratase/phosphogluconate dehydratase